jgi:5'-nucleotidase / UDP-sugar diphosphatase
MLRTFLRAALVAAGLTSGALSWAADPPAQPFELTILHVNDTHSMLDPSPVKLTVDIDAALKAKTVYVEMGGLPAAMAAVSRLRAESSGGVLFLHAGDLFQGSLYFTEYLGAADVDFWNAMHLDVATLGNHEFDKGPGLIQTALLDKASFDITCANVDVSREPAITTPALLRPYVIRAVAGQKIGVIGATNPSTPDISSPGKRIVFSDPAASVNRAVAELEG